MDEKQQRVATTAHILHKGKVLIAKRAKGDFLEHHWELVGGGLDWGELPDDGLIREVKEESGLDVKHLGPYLAHHYIHEDDGVQIVEVAYLCEIVGEPEVVLSHEHQEYRWVDEDELTDVMPMTDTMRNLIRKGFEAWKELI